MLIPVRFFIEAARFSALFPQLLLLNVEFILAILFVHGLLISTCLGIDIRYFSLVVSLINPKIITSALSPSTYPLEADEFSFLSSEPINRYTLKFSIFASANEFSKNLSTDEISSFSISIFSFTLFSLLISPLFSFFATVVETPLEIFSITS